MNHDQPRRLFFGRNFSCGLIDKAKFPGSSVAVAVALRPNDSTMYMQSHLRLRFANTIAFITHHSKRVEAEKKKDCE